MLFEERRSFSDTEELSAAVRHANVRAMQINRGTFKANLERRFIDHWSIQYIDFVDGASSCCGDAAPDRHVFLVPVRVAPDCRLLGAEVTERSIGVYTPGSEHGDVSRAGILEAVIVPPTGLLNAAEENDDQLALPGSGSHHWLVSEASYARLRRSLTRIATAPSGRDLPTAVVRSMADSLATNLIATLSAARDSDGAGRTPMPRGPILRRIADILSGRDGELVFTSELAAAADVSHPTLQRVFLEWHGLPPARYLMLRRLYLARSRLRSGEYHSVSQVAESCGFLELSRFAKRYKAVFGTLPSHTLRGLRATE